MKLLEITRSYYPSIGGLERYIKDKLKIYNNLGISCTILSTNFSSEKKIDNYNKEQNVIYLKQYTPYNITPSIFMYLKRYDAVMINSIGRFFSDIAVLYYSFFSTQIFLIPHFSFHSKKNSLVKLLYLKIFFPIISNRVEHIIAISNVEKQFWVSQGINEDKIIVIPHYVICKNEFTPHEIISSDKNYLLYVGRIGVNKKVDLLVEAFCNSPLLDMQLRLTIDVNDLSVPLRKRASEDKRIIFYGFVNEDKKNILLEEASAVVFSTSWEAFGYVAFEASQKAKPLLCSNLPVFRELLDERGVLFFENTLQSLQSALQKFGDITENEKREMGMLNYKNLERYFFEDSVEIYKRLFQLDFSEKQHE